MRVKRQKEMLQGGRRGGKKERIKMVNRQRGEGEKREREWMDKVAI